MTTAVVKISNRIEIMSKEMSLKFAPFLPSSCSITPLSSTVKQFRVFNITADLQKCVQTTEY